MPEYRRIHRLEPMAQLEVRLCMKEPAAVAARGCRFDEETAWKRMQTYDSAPARQEFFFSLDPIWWTSQLSGLTSSAELDQPAHPPSDEVCDHRHSDSDDEHVEAGAENSTTGEDRSRRTDHEV